MIENTTIIERLAALHWEAEAELAAVADEAALEQWRIRYLGRKKGALADLFASLGTLPEEEKGAAGREANRVKGVLESLYRARAEALQEARLRHDLAAETLDVTLPGRRPAVGVTDAAGKFTLGTNNVGDGAPPGKSKVAFVWLAPRIGEPGQETINDNPDKLPKPKIKIAAKYSDPEKSGIVQDVPRGGIKDLKYDLR